MSTNTYKSFAVAGVGKTVGPPIIKAGSSLLARGASVLVLTRPSSNKVLPEGVKSVQVDYTDVSTVTATLEEHSVDVLISTLGGDGFAAQIPLADAAKAAGVKLYVPSEFGMPTEGAEGGLLGSKHQTAVHLKTIGLPSLRLYTGLFQEYIPSVTSVEETGKFLIVGKGEAPVSFTAIPDIGEYLAYVLTTVPPEQLHDKTLRIEGQRGTLREIGALYAGKVPIEHVDSIPSSVPFAHIREYLQKQFDKGAGSTGWDILANKEGSEPAGGANKLYPGFRFKTVRETLGL
ncbi:NAD(P)-binding protein [Gyrodon lividus]|nr:NAD(P)-binding protein [Gyrodon lividus]